MKKHMVTGLLLAALLATAPPALAKETNGRFGLGGKVSLGGIGGVDAMYWLGNLGLNATLGFSLFSPDKGDTSFRIPFAIGGIYNFALGENANLGAGLRVGFEAYKSGSSDVDVKIDIPLRAEYFLSNNFAFNCEVGLVLKVLGGTYSTDGSTGKGISLGATTDLLGTAGFLYYF